MINLLAVAFEPPPWLKASAAQQALAVFEQEQWSPEGAALRMIVAPCRWWGAVEAIEPAMRGMDAIVLLGAQRSEPHASVIARAHNLADPHVPDAQTYLWPGQQISPRSVSVLHGGLEGEGLAEAMAAAGLSATPSVRDDYVYNRAFYTLRLRQPNVAMSLVRLPLSIESARAEGRVGAFNRLQIVEGLRAGLSWMADSLRGRMGGDKLAVAV